MTDQHRATLQDIARACGYSANTVSRALRNDNRLPLETRNVIVQTASAMGYIRNSSASTLRSGTSRTVAVIVNDISNPYYSNMLSEMDALLQQKDYHIMILCTQVNDDLAEKMIHIAISRSVDGILFFPHNNAGHIECMQRAGVPFVLLDRWIKGVTVDTARCDDEMGGRLAGEHLAALGHRKMIYLAGPNVNSSQQDRQAGLMSALEKAGLPADSLKVIPWKPFFQKPQPGELLSVLEPIDYSAMITYNDELAYYCMNDLRLRGVRVPEDVSMISFDHIRRGHAYLPPLTSVTADGPGVAETAVKLLLNRIDHRDLPPQIVVVPVRIYDEETTARPANSLK
ncbi:MAG TPA: LacI family DNA-binding transcriptional regulator [Candidatus Limiplasma sp.]|nr:LacI family DNA-binding transcriptional regulator [Candidatus Limiplasma sp.]